MDKTEILARLSDLYAHITTTVDDPEDLWFEVLEALEDILGITE